MYPTLVNDTQISHGMSCDQVIPNIRKSDNRMTNFSEVVFNMFQWTKTFKICSGDSWTLVESTTVFGFTLLSLVCLRIAETRNPAKIAHFKMEAKTLGWVGKEAQAYLTITPTSTCPISMKLTTWKTWYVSVKFWKFHQERSSLHWVTTASILLIWARYSCVLTVVSLFQIYMRFHSRVPVTNVGFLLPELKYLRFGVMWMTTNSASLRDVIWHEWLRIPML